MAATWAARRVHEDILLLLAKKSLKLGELADEEE